MPMLMDWMGYSVRSHYSRFTVWLPAPGGNDSHVNWDASRVDSFHVDGRFDELYAYPSSGSSSSTGIDFNALDTTNLAYEVAHAATVAHMFSVARRFFDRKSIQV